MNGLLEASRMLNGHGVFRAGEFDPAALLKDACQVHRDAAHGILITEAFTSLPGLVRGDARLLFHLFSNLISNAIKYSPSGSPVEVSAGRDDACWVVQVRDHAIGIPGKDRSRLFERYFRGSKATGIADAAGGDDRISRPAGLIVVSNCPAERSVTGSWHE